MSPKPDATATVTYNVCEHGDHPAPDGMRFCSPECAQCELSSFDENETTCAGVCKIGAPSMMTFGEAIKNMQHGLKVSRSGWNGRGMYVFVASVTMATDVNGESFEPKDPYPCLVLKAADDRLVFGWLASQTDMLATDWGVVDA